MKSSGIRKLILALALLMLAWHAYSISCNSRYYCITKEIKYISMEEISGAYLNATAIAKHAVKNITQCQQFCIKGNKCWSINLIVNKTNGYDCHLLDLNIYSNSSLVVKEKTSSHFYIPSKCSENPCKNGGVCVPKYLNDSYVCECSSNGSWISRGKHCEIVLSGYKSAFVHYSLNDIKVRTPYTATDKDLSTNLITWDGAWVFDRKSPVAICRSGGSSCTEFTGLIQCLTKFDDCKSTVTYSVWVKFRTVEVNTLTHIFQKKLSKKGVRFTLNKDGYHFSVAISAYKLWKIMNFGKWVTHTEWNQFTFTLDDNSIACAYINGVKEKCITVPTKASYKAGSNPFVIGGYWTSNNKEPSMYYDDFAIWQAAFTAEEVMNLYNSSKD